MNKFDQAYIRAGVQSVAWIIFTVVILWIPAEPRTPLFAYKNNSGVLVFQLILIWLNTYWLFPKIYLRKRYFFYFTITALILAMGAWLFLHGQHAPPRDPQRVLFRPIPRPSLMVRVFSSMYPMFFSLAISFFWEFSTAFWKKEKAYKQLIHEKLHTELQLLKFQINPHFLFNALNNIYSLSILKSERTPESIAQLSDMLRYVIYDCERDHVPLKKELDYIRDYVNLFQLKRAKGLNIHLQLPYSHHPHIIPPMIFIPFVENALKHSYLENTTDSWAEIIVQVQQKTINFKVSNSIPTKKVIKDKVGGVGLENVKRRLAILFPECHQLQIQSSPDEYHVHLTIQLP